MESSKGYFVTTRKASEYFDVHPSTLRRWDAEGKIKTIRVSNRRRYFIPINIDDHNKPSENSEKQKVCYVRVSSSKQINDLERQENFMKVNFPDHRIIRDIGSGINWKRKGLKEILELAMKGELQEVVIAHRDRLCRFAFELIEWILKKNKCELIVVDNKIKNNYDKFTSDLLSIIHVFNCKMMGMRRYGSKLKIK